MSWGRLHSTNRSLRVLACALAVAVPAVVVAPAAPPAEAAAVRVVVAALPGQSAEVEAALTALGGAPTRAIPLVEGFAATLPADRVARLAASPGVRFVAPDRPLRLMHAVDGYDGSTDRGSTAISRWAIGVRDYWASGLTGRGIDVALIDSGVAPVEGLTLPGKVVNGPDLSFESQADHLRHLDTFGHGTHLAGLIAGRDAAAPTDNRMNQEHDAFLGVAPDARVVSVKVADATGATDVSQVLAAIDWVVRHRRDNGLNVRVLALAFGTDSAQHHTVDPLAFAVEMAWRKGIVVVVAGGNDGPGAGRLRDPASDPYVLAVGADDTRGTATAADDVVAPFSSWGSDERAPDVIAPGQSVVSLRVPGSHVDQRFPEGIVNARFTRGSGTSQAAAMVAGAAALVVQQRPNATPDEVKALLTSTARPLAGADRRAQGAGLVNLAAAKTAPTPAVRQAWAAARGTGTLEGSRGSAHLVRDGVELRGEQDIFGMAFDSAAWATAAANEQSWSNGTWNGSSWSGSSWSGSSWSGSSWSGSSWSGSSWSGSSWSGSSWSGSSWSGSSWSGSSWSGSSWSGSSWSTGSWS